MFYSLSPSYIYHWIRGQNTLKIYVMYNFLDIGDALLRKVGHCNIENICSTLHKRSFWNTLVACIQGTVYIQIHTFVLFVQMLTLFAAFNSSTNNLLILLLSTNIAEIKISLFKRVDNVMLFRFFCNDVVERVQLFIYCAIIFGQQEERWKMLVQKVAIMAVTETIVDWLKYNMFIRLFPKYIQYYVQFYNGLFVEVVKAKLKYAQPEDDNASPSKIFLLPYSFPRCTESPNMRFYGSSMEHFFLLSKNLNFVSLPHITLAARFIFSAAAEMNIGWVTWGLIVIIAVLLYCTIDLELYDLAISRSCFSPPRPPASPRTVSETIAEKDERQ